ncbi:DUF3040 domain-containing protein [Rhodococcus sp. X156]|uniref:DUF3040 domain-containing protein n=1 Tax=Rhodococcus sp. X156 TaxID=2499145 RepID=UPI000FDA2BEC|nr:DUF3040 domain-containing protein [Rhodococcus sp. X156]
MPLSEHEQRLLDQIESALYAEDPKFASNVRTGRGLRVGHRRGVQSVAVFLLGLVLLVGGIALPLKPGGVPVVSVLGFLVMFAAGVLLLLGRGRADAPGAGDGASGHGRRETRSTNRSDGGGFSAKMEERFKRRFDQE